MGIKERILAMNNAVGKVETALLIIFTLTFVTLVFMQWVLRLVNVGFLWMEEMIRFSMLWSGFLGGCVAVAKHGHFRIDLVRFLAPKGLLPNILKATGHLVGATVCLFYFIATIGFINTSIAYDEGLHYYSSIPLWPFYAILPYFFGTTCIRFVISALFKLFGPTGAEDDEVA